MKKRIALGILSIFACVCLCCLCCEPAEGTPMNEWVVWELAWMAALAIDAKIISKLDPETK